MRERDGAGRSQPPGLRVSRLLEGGDLRSIGAANVVAQQAQRDPDLMGELLAGMLLHEPVVRMRCADALEKATRSCPEVLQSNAANLLRLLSDEQPKELLWHLIQMTPRVRWTPGQLVHVFRRLEECTHHSSSIVKANAMQALVELIQQAPERRWATANLLRTLVRTGTPAMRARGRKLLVQLARR